MSELFINPLVQLRTPKTLFRLVVVGQINI